jgi:hypothetical protein
MSKTPEEYYTLTFVWADTDEIIGTLSLSDIQSQKPLAGFPLASLLTLRKAPSRLVLPVTADDLDALAKALPPLMLNFPPWLLIATSFGSVGRQNKPQLYLEGAPLGWWAERPFAKISAIWGERAAFKKGTNFVETTAQVRAQIAEAMRAEV